MRVAALFALATAVTSVLILPHCSRNQSSGTFLSPPLSPTQLSVVSAARELTRRDIGFTLEYFSGGVPPENKGACVDVVIRSLRAAGINLQELMYDDIRAYPEAYPLQRWNQTKADPNIDHRRCPNQIVFFKRHGIQLTTRVDPRSAGNISQWQGGDIVFWDLANRGAIDHVGIVSDKRNRRGIPYVVHHLPPGRVAEEDSLTRWKIVGHFRYPKPSSS